MASQGEKEKRPKAPTNSTSFFSATQFFEHQTPPPNLAAHHEQVQEFVDRHAKQGRKVVLVTSGGTTVPLEQNVVRFLDNFSAGTRGATSAEYFLESGYAVIFMHRQHSLSPYTRHYSHTTNPFLDLLTTSPSSAQGSGDGGRKTEIRVLEQHATALLPVLEAYHRAVDAGTLLRIPFTTVTEYLFMLRDMSRLMRPLGRRGMYYLAAAVSDFYVPSQKTPEHKIQSGKGSLVIEMDQVPKVLKPMVQQWAPEGYIVSFKLETDQDLLIPKARAALERYGHQVVVGNDLHRRKFEVVFVEPDSSQEEGYRETWIKLKPPLAEAGADAGTRSDTETKPGATGGTEKEIEEDIVRELSKRHEDWIRQGSQ
ncbi:DFP-domain-containing protein [Acaromyces ingoldii]|uniref:DFP-domain-containing protein n=1 Tax=Acaromyces ingoldii TaxID=215250 RepID=A0A316YJD8_9BASI|nr:DFP-domain-containing protein [Acaromyces ingoldii]PWN89537.1 DFP-domain-containing protein [Acaromyces ingoldii]